MATFTFTNSTGLTFADNGTVQQSLNVYGAYIGIATGFSLALNGLTHTRVSDLDMLLVAPDGQANLEFWSDVGGSSSVAGANFLITDDAAAPLPRSGTLQGGTYLPVDSGEVETGSNFGGYTGSINHAQPNGTATLLSSFQFQAINGAWTLRVADDTRLATGKLESWSLTINTNNESSKIDGTEGDDVFSFAVIEEGSGSYSVNDWGSVRYSGVSFFGLDGKGGNDLISGSFQSDTIIGGAGRDTIHAGLGNDNISINAGDDVAGEVYDGGADYDFIGVGARGPTSASYDLRDDTLSSIEELYFSGDVGSTVLLNANQFGSGLALNATIDGSADSTKNAINVYMGSQRTLDLSNIVFEGPALSLDQFTIFGDGDAETIKGTSGADNLNGGAGTDAMTGGAGNDIFYVDAAADKVVEAAGAAGGSDTVRASASYALGAGVAVERLETTLATGTGAINLFGNELAQTITGNDGANQLLGNAGADIIGARGGADGIQGGLGNDTLAGNGGSDNFYFNTALNAATNVDRILDFSQASGNSDLVRLENAIFTGLTATGFLSASLFKANATGTATEADDRIVYETDTGRLFHDANGSAAGGATQFATITNFASLTGAAALGAGDFYVY